MTLPAFNKDVRTDRDSSFPHADVIIFVAVCIVMAIILAILSRLRLMKKREMYSMGSAGTRTMNTVEMPHNRVTVVGVSSNGPPTETVSPWSIFLSSPNSAACRPRSFAIHVEDTPKSTEGHVCPICLSEIVDEQVASSSCKHYCHVACLTEWVSRTFTPTCPVCRSPVQVIE